MIDGEVRPRRQKSWDTIKKTQESLTKAGAKAKQTAWSQAEIVDDRYSLFKVRHSFVGQ